MICVTEENVMFKSWIRDIREHTEVKMGERRENASKHLIGTDGYFKNVQIRPGIKARRDYVSTGKVVNWFMDIELKEDNIYLQILRRRGRKYRVRTHNNLQMLITKAHRYQPRDNVPPKVQ